MELKNILIVVKDIEKSKQFYNDLFGLDLVLDNDGCFIYNSYKIACQQQAGNPPVFLLFYYSGKRPSYMILNSP